MSGRDDLAKALLSHGVAATKGFGIEEIACACEVSWTGQHWRAVLDHYAHVAAAILSSAWLAQHDREVAARAWDEGDDNGFADAEGRTEQLTNPYHDPEPVPERHDTSCALLVRHAPCDCPRGPE